MCDGKSLAICDLRFRAAVFEPKTPSFCGISGDLVPSTQKAPAIAIVRFWCAKEREVFLSTCCGPLGGWPLRELTKAEENTSSHRVNISGMIVLLPELFVGVILILDDAKCRRFGLVKDCQEAVKSLCNKWHSNRTQNQGK